MLTSAVLNILIWGKVFIDKQIESTPLTMKKDKKVFFAAICTRICTINPSDFEKRAPYQVHGVFYHFVKFFPKKMLIFNERGGGSLFGNFSMTR